jgi:hypothetical protein
LSDVNFDCESAKFADFFESGIIPNELKDIDAAILWLADAEKIRGSMAEMNIRTLAIKPFGDKKSHIGIQYLNKIADFFCGEGTCADDFIRDLSASDSKKCVVWNKILIHPGSGGTNKNYPPEFYLQIGEYMTAKFAKPCFYVFGPVERERKMDMFYPEAARLYPKDCLELKNLILKADIFIGNDSGPCHLSAFCGIKTIVFFKNSDPNIWHPLGKNVNIINEKKSQNVFLMIEKIVQSYIL